MKYNMLENAIDFLDHAVELFISHHDDYNPKLKHALLAANHCIELLLKEKLRRINHSLVYDNIDKIKPGHNRTVSFRKSILRLINIAGVNFEERQKKLLRRCEEIRNEIIHYEFKFNTDEVKTILCRAISFTIDFSREQLSEDFEDRFRQDGTWRQLLDHSDFLQERG